MSHTQRHSSALLGHEIAGNPTYHSQLESVVDITIVPWLKWESWHWLLPRNVLHLWLPLHCPSTAPPLPLIAALRDVAQTWFQCRHYVTTPNCGLAQPEQGPFASASVDFLHLHMFPASIVIDSKPRRADRLGKFVK